MALNEAGNPYRSPCCFECGDCVSVFRIDTGGTVPVMDGDWETCTTNSLADWVMPSHTAKKKCNSDNGYFATAVQTPFTNCRWQAAQYCIDDPDGYRGRSWVVDVYFKDDTDTVTTLTDVVQDWRCTCKGPRFEWTLSGDIPDCLTPVAACNCDYTCLTFSYASTTLNPVMGSSCVVAGRTVTMTGGPDGCGWSEGSFPPSNLTGGGGGPFSLQVAFRGTGCATTPIYRRANADGCIGEYTLYNNLGVTSGLPATITVSAC